MSDKLYLASSSMSRQMLLREAGIPFTVIPQSADESVCDWTLPLEPAVKGIALHKMQHVLLPEGHEGEFCFVLTADTLTETKEGKLEGKPIDRADAIAKLRSARQGVCTGTAVCLERRLFKNGCWAVEEQRMLYAQAHYIFNVPEHELDFYLDNVPVVGAGAIAIEGFGNQFLERLEGSYSAVVGLPMYELRRALTKLSPH